MENVEESNKVITDKDKESDSNWVEFKNMENLEDNK